MSSKSIDPSLIAAAQAGDAAALNKGISETGKIQVPFDNSLYDKEVEVIIKPKQRKQRNELSASEFVNKWAGFLKTE